ncbi:isocitrate/isopropylmalate dehydrogenase family protein [Mycobacterium kansasii]|nr:isocitrate/isopropylmalate dehydrogenase family protein [Mycobacterium kansasii]
MLDHFGLHHAARRVEAAIEIATGSGILTRDIGGTATTDEMTDAVIAALTSLRSAA